MNDLMRASELMRTDLRFRTIVDSIVARTMQEHGRVDPDRADDDAHDIARKVAALLLAHIYDGDAELAALRLERDHWKAHAIGFIRTEPLQLIIPKPDKEDGR